MLIDLLGPATIALGVAYAPCPAPPPAAVRVLVTKHLPRLDASRSTGELTAMNHGSFIPHGFENGSTRGLTNSSIGVSTRFGYGWLADQRGRDACLWVTEVTVEITARSVVYVDRNHPRGTCSHNAILEHEMKHVQVNETVAEASAPLLKAAVERRIRAIGAIGPFPVHAVPAAQERISAPVKQTIDATAAQVIEERERRQRAIDTPEEYRRVATQCRGGR